MEPSIRLELVAEIKELNSGCPVCIADVSNLFKV
jgi:hypothetical protein